MKKKSFVYGAIILGLASIFCKILGAIFRIPLTYLLGAEGVGIYQLVYPIFALFLVASTSGIPTSLSKIISKEISGNNNKNAKIIFKESIKIMLILGILFSLIVVGFSGVISKIQGNASIQICYFILAPSIILGSVISAFRGYYQGFEIMKYSAISQIIEQLFKVVCGLFFAYIFLKYGLIYGVFGAFVGLTVSELIAFIYLFIAYKTKNLKINFEENSSNLYTKKDAIKLILKESIPITLAQIVVPITSVVDSLIIIKLLSMVGFDKVVGTSLYGLDSGVVASLINLPSVIAVSIGISLMPSISSSFALKNTKDVDFKSKLSIKIVWYFTLPCVLIFFLYSKEVCYFLYGNLTNNNYNALLVASIMLKLSSFSIVYIALNQILTTTLQALNKSYFAFYVILLASLIKVILTICLVSNPQVNIYGLVISDVICYSFASVVNLFELRKVTNINFKFREIFTVPFVALVFMAGVLILFKILLPSTLSRLMILISISVSFVIYLLIVLLLKGFNLKEVKNTKILNFFNRKKY